MEAASATKGPFWLGVAVAPWTAPLIVFGFALARTLMNEGLDGLAYWQFAVGIFLFFAVPVSYLAMFALALPFLLWLRKLGRLTWLNCCAGGTVIGAIAFPAAMWLISSVSSPALVLPGAGFGLASAVVFCIVTRPN